MHIIPSLADSICLGRPDVGPGLGTMWPALAGRRGLVPLVIVPLSTGEADPSVDVSGARCDVEKARHNNETLITDRPLIIGFFYCLCIYPPAHRQTRLPVVLELYPSGRLLFSQHRPLRCP